VDVEIHNIIEECSKKCRDIITEHRVDVENFAAALIEKETLDIAEITKILGERPYPLPQSVRDIINFRDEEEEDQVAEKIDAVKEIEPKIELAL